MGSESSTSLESAKVKIELLEAMRLLLSLTEGKDMECSCFSLLKRLVMSLHFPDNSCNKAEGSHSKERICSSQVCKLLLAAWLSHLLKSSWVAIDDRDKLVGYLIMSGIIRPPANAFCKERVIWVRVRAMQ